MRVAPASKWKYHLFEDDLRREDDLSLAWSLQNFEFVSGFAACKTQMQASVCLGTKLGCAQRRWASRVRKAEEGSDSSNVRLASRAPFIRRSISP